MKNKTINVLIELGIPANVAGFQYIVDAMCLFEDKDWRNGKITVLYEKIAKMNNTTASRVERGMRTAFDSALSRGNSGQVARYLTFQKPTNGNLLHVLYLRLTEEE